MPFYIFRCIFIGMQILYFFILSFTVLISIFYLFQKNAGLIYLKCLSPILFLTFFLEIFSHFIVKEKGIEAKTFVYYNPLTTIEFVYYLWMIRTIITNRIAKKVFLSLIIIYPIAAGINIFFFQGRTGFHVSTYSFGCLMIVTCCIYYFYELFLIPHSVNPLSQSSFWICTGLLFYYAFTYPMFGLVNLITSLPLVIINNIGNIIYLLNVLLYSMFSIAYLCRIRIRK